MGDKGIIKAISIPKVQFRVMQTFNRTVKENDFNSKGPIQRHHPGCRARIVDIFQFQRSNSEKAAQVSTYWGHPISIPKVQFRATKGTLTPSMATNFNSKGPIQREFLPYWVEALRYFNSKGPIQSLLT